jgi:glycine dehydrogenase subunit 1
VKYLPVSDTERSEMLAAIGAASVDDLFASLPRGVLAEAALPPPAS